MRKQDEVEMRYRIRQIAQIFVHELYERFKGDPIELTDEDLQEDIDVLVDSLMSDVVEWMR